MIYRYFIYRLKLLLQQIFQDFSPELKGVKSGLANIKIKNNEIYQILQYRKKLLSNTNKISYTELGAGSRKTNIKEIKVKDIAKYAGSDKKKGILLYKLVNYFKPEIIIELGTSLGLSTLYLACANRKCPLITVEGNLSLINIAKKEAESQGFTNIQFIHSDFDNILEDLLIQKKNKKTFVFIDGNHNHDSTIKYFKLFLKHIGNESVILIDDINWSKDMDKAWHQIKSDRGIKYTIDLFYAGLIKLGKDIENKHYITSI